MHEVDDHNHMLKTTHVHKCKQKGRTRESNS